MSERWRRNAERAGLLALLVLALAIRLVGLGVFPDTVSPDEADNAQDALRAIAGYPRPGGFFGLDWKPQPAYSVYLIRATMALVGQSVMAIRLPSALLGALALIPLFWIARRQVGAWAALAATFLMATNLWHVHFSRSGWENIQVGTYALAAIACLLRAIELLRIPDQPRRSWMPWFAGAGLFCALGLYSYFSGRLIVLIIVAYGLLIWRDEPALRRGLLRGYGVLLGVALALFAPMLPALLGNWEYANTRITTVLITNQPGFAERPLEILGRQAWENLAVFWDGTYSNNTRYNPIHKPLLDTLTRLLVLGGLLLSLRRAGERRIWWLLLLIGWGATQVLSGGTPDGARGTIFLPAFFLFTAPAIAWLQAAAGRLRLRMRAPVMALLVVLLAAIGGDNLTHYLLWQASAGGREERQPYIPIGEYPLWAETVKDHARLGGGGLSVDDWHQLSAPGAAVPPVEPTPAPQVQQPAPAPGPADPATPTPSAPEVGFILVPRGNWPALTAINLSDAWEIREPRAVAADSAGFFYVLDSAPEMQSITRIDRDGRPVGRWGGAGAADTPGRFVAAWGLAVTPSDEVLVLDSETGWIHVFSTEGALLRQIGGPALVLYNPRAITVSADGAIYIADTGGARVVVLSPDGTLLRSFGDAPGGAVGDGVLREPSGVAVNGDSVVLVADAADGRVRRYAPEGEFLGFWLVGTEVASDGPRLSAAADGAIWAVLPRRCALVLFSADGVSAQQFGMCDQRDYLPRPSAIAATREGRLIVADLTRGVLLTP
jgi:4-amino-4-deoxy-L-arabinose transferase-like glycosyltransferase